MGAGHKVLQLLPPGHSLLFPVQAEHRAVQGMFFILPEELGVFHQRNRTQDPLIHRFDLPAIRILGHSHPIHGVGHGECAVRVDGDLKGSESPVAAALLLRQDVGSSAHHRIILPQAEGDFAAVMGGDRPGGFRLSLLLDSELHAVQRGLLGIEVAAVVLDQGQQDGIVQELEAVRNIRVPADDLCLALSVEKELHIGTVLRQDIPIRGFCLHQAVHIPGVLGRGLQDGTQSSIGCLLHTAKGHFALGVGDQALTCLNLCQGFAIPRVKLELRPCQSGASDRAHPGVLGEGKGEGRVLRFHCTVRIDCHRQVVRIHRKIDGDVFQLETIRRCGFHQLIPAPGQIGDHKLSVSGGSLHRWGKGRTIPAGNQLVLLPGKELPDPLDPVIGALVTVQAEPGSVQCIGRIVQLRKLGQDDRSGNPFVHRADLPAVRIRSHRHTGRRIGQGDPAVGIDGEHEGHGLKSTHCRLRQSVGLSAHHIPGAEGDLSAIIRGKGFLPAAAIRQRKLHARHPLLLCKEVTAIVLDKGQRDGIIVELEPVSIRQHIQGRIRAVFLHNLHLAPFIEPEFHIGCRIRKDIAVRRFGFHQAVAYSRLRAFGSPEQGRAVRIQTAQPKAARADLQFLGQQISAAVIQLESGAGQVDPRASAAKQACADRVFGNRDVEGLIRKYEGISRCFRGPILRRNDLHLILAVQPEGHRHIRLDVARRIHGLLHGVQLSHDQLACEIGTGIGVIRGPVRKSAGNTKLPAGGDPVPIAPLFDGEGRLFIHCFQQRYTAAAVNHQLSGGSRDAGGGRFLIGGGLAGQGESGADQRGGIEPLRDSGFRCQLISSLRQADDIHVPRGYGAGRDDRA